MRSGQFGVGALAAFLIGSEVDVRSTRHLTTDPNDGLTFKPTIEADAIELTRVNRPVGTTVRVRISDPRVWKSLSNDDNYELDESGVAFRESGVDTWDWYCLAHPKVERLLVKPSPGTKTDVIDSRLKQEYSLTNANSALSHRWRRVRHRGYKDIQWSYWERPVPCLQRHYRDERGFPAL